jgi:formylmethanofuran dehydrogenase subunit C
MDKCDCASLLTHIALDESTTTSHCRGGEGSAAGVLVVSGSLRRVLPGVSGAGVAEKFATRAVVADEGEFDGNLGSVGGVAGAWVW